MIASFLVAGIVRTASLKKANLELTEKLFIVKINMLLIVIINCIKIIFWKIFFL